MNEEQDKAKQARKAAAKVQAVEDRITGMLVRRGVPFDKLQETQTKIAKRLHALHTTHGLIRWRDVEIVTNLVLKDPT